MTAHDAPAKTDSRDELRPGWLANTRIQFAAVCAAILGFAYALNAATPMLADDFTYAFVWGTPESMQSLSALARSQWITYFNWSGRAVNNTLYQAFVWFGRPTFNVVNSIVFLALVLLIYVHANGLRAIRVSLLVGIPVLLWFALPSFGQSVLWMAGATSYPWMCVLVMGALLPFRLHAESPGVIPDTILVSIAVVPLCLLGGWSNENLGPVAVLIMLALAVYSARRGVRTPKWIYTGVASALAGTVLLLGSPGNAGRMGEMDPGVAAASLPNLVNRFLAITHGIFLDNLFALTAFFVLLVVLLSRFPAADGRNRSLTIAYFYLAGAYLAIYALVLSPVVAARQWTASIVLAVAALGCVYAALDFGDPFIRRFMRLALGFSVVMFTVSFAYAYSADILVTSRQWRDRVTYIEARKALGEKDLVVPPIAVLTTHNGAWGLVDLSQDAGERPNVDVARYFGLRSIRASAETGPPVAP